MAVETAENPKEVKTDTSTEEAHHESASDSPDSPMVVSTEEDVQTVTETSVSEVQSTTKEHKEDYAPDDTEDKPPSKTVSVNLDTTQVSHVQTSTESQEDPFQTPTQDSSSSATLDSLLSPTEPDTRFPLRQSVAETDVTDDDTRFSTVPLSARQSLDTVQISEDDADTPTGEGGSEEQDRRATLDGSELIRLVHTNRIHKKTASTSTIVSANNVPFILARLEGDEDTRRTSIGGQEKLKEEFDRKHDSQSSIEAELVDWSSSFFFFFCSRMQY